MKKTISDTLQTRDRSSVDGRGEDLLVRLQSDQVSALDAWINRQPEPKPSRSDALRRLLQKGLDRARFVPNPEIAKARQVASRSRAEEVVDKALAKVDAPAEEKDRRKRKLTRIGSLKPKKD